eukprot:2803721-Rhodomonas_salina.1
MSDTPFLCASPFSAHTTWPTRSSPSEAAFAQPSTSATRTRRSMEEDMTSKRRLAASAGGSPASSSARSADTHHATTLVTRLRCPSTTLTAKSACSPSAFALAIHMRTQSSSPPVTKVPSPC